MAINEYVALNMLTFSRNSNLSSGSALPAAPGPAEVVVKLLRKLLPSYLSSGPAGAVVKLLRMLQVLP